MSKYVPNDFIKKLSKVMKKNFPTCPYCGGKHFNTTENFAVILVNNDYSSFNIGPSIPTGMVICENCGHIDFFALGALNKIKEEDQKDGKGTNN